MKKLYTERDYTLLYFFYPLLCILCLLQVRGVVPPYYPATGMASWPFRLLIIYLGGKAFLRYSGVNKLLTTFVVYSLLTVVCYLFNERPFSLYIIESVAYVTPMLFAFVALDKNDLSDRFYKVFLYTMIVCFVFGFYLHFLRPLWYQTALTITYNDRWYTMTDYDYESVADSFRFSSIFITSYAISHFSMFTLPVCLAMIMKSDKKMRKRYVLFALIAFISAIICLHRVAMASCILMIGLYLLYDFRHGKKLSSMAIWLIVVVVGSIAYLSTTDIFEQVVSRFNEMNLTDAFDDSRIDQNNSVYRIWNNYLLGEGIGSMSADARKLGFPGITDGNYMKILVEEGIIGFGLYIILILKTLLRGLKYFKYLSVEFCMVLGISIAMMGSNSLVMPFYILPFWYAIGRIWNKEYLQHLVKTNNHI